MFPGYAVACGSGRWHRPGQQAPPFDDRPEPVCRTRRSTATSSMVESTARQPSQTSMAVTVQAQDEMQEYRMRADQEPHRTPVNPTPSIGQGHSGSSPAATSAARNFLRASNRTLYSALDVEPSGPAPIFESDSAGRPVWRPASTADCTRSTTLVHGPCGGPRAVPELPVPLRPTPGAWTTAGRAADSGTGRRSGSRCESR